MNTGIRELSEAEIWIAEIKIQKEGWMIKLRKSQKKRNRDDEVMESAGRFYICFVREERE